MANGLTALNIEHKLELGVVLQHMLAKAALATSMHQQSIKNMRQWHPCRHQAVQELLFIVDHRHSHPPSKQLLPTQIFFWCRSI